MAYVENLLADGEQLVRREHQHWFVLIANAAYAIIMWIIAVLVLLLTATILKGNGPLSSIGGWTVVVLVLVGLAWFGWQALRWQNEEFLITTRRVLQVEGVVNKTVIDSSLEKINDAILKVSLFGRMFGFGDLEVLTASESGISRLRMLRNANEFKRTMLDAKHELELELSGAKPMPSPAMRAAPVIVPSTPAADAAEAPMSADDVTRALASLAELRDRGAISAEDYEAKKAELLGRL